MKPTSIAYLSFDIVPAAKGAATHIQAFTQTLANRFGSLELVTVSPIKEVTKPATVSPKINHIALPAVGKTLIQRVLHFRQHLRLWLYQRQFQAIHFRSIYEGFPLVTATQKHSDKMIFEVNGLPSIELKYRYPDVAEDRELMQKLLYQEQVCLEAADLIITPSQVTRNYLLSRQVAEKKILVIPNGVDLNVFKYKTKREPYFPAVTKLIYFGTLSQWQGVDVAVRAIAQCQAEFPIQFKIIGTGSRRQIEALTNLINKLNLAESVIFENARSQPELVAEIHQSNFILAPLTINDRNLTQGCCPLKILEGMATGIPAIASDLPVVRELGIDRHHFYLVKPNSVDAIAAAIRHLRNHPNLCQFLANNARQQIENHYTWERAGAALIAAYEDLGCK
jgi:glycosyltransferase involved in cell wall biosynthesis